MIIENVNYRLFQEFANRAGKAEHRLDRGCGSRAGGQARRHGAGDHDRVDGTVVRARWS